MNHLHAIKLTELKGIGVSRAELFFRVGVENLMDLLYYFPRSYLDERNRTAISNIQLGEDVVIRARLISAPRNFHKGKWTVTNARIADESGELAVVWFNQPYLMKNLVEGQLYLFKGKVKRNYNRIQLTSPQVQKAAEDMPGIVPVYPLGGGLTQKMVQAAIAQALEYLTEEYDPLPGSYRQNLMGWGEAVKAMHHPASFEEQEKARHRLVFDELFVQQLALHRMKSRLRGDTKGYRINCDTNAEDRFLSALPYQLTGAQRRVWQEIQMDLVSDRAMNRLVQGDVGCGKTMVALLAMYAAACDGYQAALMAPTEVLARQHLSEAKRLLEPLGIRIALLTGNVKGKERKGVMQGLEDGSVQLIIGTHALISEPVKYHRLGLVITDEQHRFGVRQRMALAEKGEAPNVLVMTATPIPRTLAMILYGDMDISIIDEMPPGRTPVQTFCVDETYEKRLHVFMQKQVDQGRQVYVICPMVEEAEESELRSATEYADFLQRIIFPNLSVGLLHGQMKPVDKERVMEAFAKGEIHILVATTVVEVGVNVPNATLMIIENAERFGLAQLHQLRGRVGRGSAESYCVLVTDSQQIQTRKRMKTMVDSTDGFFIAEEDLRLRGAGDVFGLRQHGLPDFKLADLYKDMAILKEAQALAHTVMEMDPTLELLEHRGLAKELEAFWQRAVIE